MMTRMQLSAFWIGILIMVLAVLCTAVRTSGQSKKTWVYKGCYVRQCVTEYLNNLPQDAQAVISYDTDAKFDAYDIWVQR